jgi:cyclohexyl-isocyanide hydratase
MLASDQGRETKPMEQKHPTLHIGFVLYPELTQLDLTGPWEVLARLPNAVCHLVAADMSPVRSASGGLAILPNTTFADCPQLDVLCAPGGPGHLAAMEDRDILAFLRAQAGDCRAVTAVCTGALVLAAAGLLDGYRATTHWLSVDRLAAFGATPEKSRVVVDRNRITGGGVTAGIDFALTLAAQLSSVAMARAIQLQIEYAPAPPYQGTPETADPRVVAAVRAAASLYMSKIADVDARALARLKAERPA